MVTTKTLGDKTRGYNCQRRQEPAHDATANADTARALGDHVVCAIHQVKAHVVSSAVLEQRCVFDRDLVVGCPLHEDDTTWLVRSDPEARQSPDEECDDEHHDHEGNGDEEDLTLLLRGCGDGTPPP